MAAQKVFVPLRQLGGIGRRAVGMLPLAGVVPKEPDKDVVLNTKGSRT